jgi:hypothetical protein
VCVCVPVLLFACRFSSTLPPGLQLDVKRTQTSPLYEYHNVIWISCQYSGVLLHTRAGNKRFLLFGVSSLRGAVGSAPGFDREGPGSIPGCAQFLLSTQRGRKASNEPHPNRYETPMVVPIG